MKMIIIKKIISRKINNDEILKLPIINLKKDQLLVINKSNIIKNQLNLKNTKKVKYPDFYKVLLTEKLLIN